MFLIILREPKILKLLINDFYLGYFMKKHINIYELHISFNNIKKEIANCFLPFTPKARRLRKHLLTLISDINFIKDLSYNFKLELEQLMQQSPVTEDIKFNVKSYIYDLELILVYVAKYDDKIEKLSYWFEQYAITKSYIIQNTKKKYVASDTVNIDQVNPEVSQSETKFIKFNHLL